MDELLKTASLIRHGKGHNLLKPFLNILFVSVITFAIIKKIYVNLPIPSNFPIEMIIDFFLNGKFIIPLGFFFLVWVLTSAPSQFIFQWFNDRIGEKQQRKILDFSFAEAFTLLGTNKQLKEKLPIQTKRKNWIFDLYEKVSKSIPSKEAARMLKQIQRAKFYYTTDFILLIRSIITSIIVFNQSLYFNNYVLAILIMAHVIMGFLLVFGYQLAAVTPIIVSKLKNEYEEFKRQEEIAKVT
ncbi:MAG: hypothetical protein J0M08_09805 [Bacteroidetes bacterium]|nr:hypothetical protein [Bacteroidota bacterium]